MRIDARALHAAWQAARAAGVDPFSLTAPDQLPRVAGWSALGLPSTDIHVERRVTLLDALRALALGQREADRARSPVQVVGTLPLRSKGVQSTRDALRTVISAASSELLLVGYTIRDEGLSELLVQKALAGVAVTVIGDRKTRAARDLRRTWPYGVAIVALEDVEGDDDLRSLHAKVVVADRRSALVGSANFTVSGLARNLEVGLRVEGEPARQIVEMFDELRKEGWLVDAGVS